VTTSRRPRAVDADPVGIDTGVPSDGVNGSDRIGEDAPVVVGVRIVDPAGDEPWRLRYADRIGVRCLANPVPIAALAPGARDGVGSAARPPTKPLDRKPAAIAVGEVLDNTWQTSLPPTRQVEP